MAEMIEIEVAYASPDVQRVRQVSLPAGATVADALAMSGLAEECPVGTIAADRLGIFSRKVGPDALLSDGDRIEIYRPLTLDPKEARRRRAVR